MITRAEISEFCKKNKIKEPWFNPNDPKDTSSIITMSEIDYFRKFYKRRPSDLWIYLSIDDDKKEHHYTEYYDPKLKQYYVSDKPTWSNDYEFNAPCYLKYVIPFSSYNEDKIIWLFNHTIEHGNSKLHPVFGEFEFDYAPFSTLDELNYLYDKSIKNIEDNFVYLSDPNFVQTINKYKENTEHINELTKANEDLKNKACTILLKKAVISNEFEEKESNN
jgi:hypothetical protein